MSVEKQLAALQEQVAMEAGLRAALDSDVSALDQRVRVALNLIKAIQATQSEHGAKLAQLDTRVQALDTKVDALDTKVDALDTKVDALGGDVRQGMAGISALLQALIDREPPPAPN
jgi:outer membrane murein-binding lipoprotein Lpp